jgi:hypothetical protein
MKTTMERSDTVAVLNRILQILCRSLPRYLKDAKPWSRRDQQPVQTALDNLVADQEMYAGRLSELILAENGRPDPGVFPTAFTSIHDLSLDYLLGEVLERLSADLAALRVIAAKLPAGSTLRALADEIVGNVQGHLEILQGLG